MMPSRDWLQGRGSIPPMEDRELEALRRITGPVSEPQGPSLGDYMPGEPVPLDCLAGPTEVTARTGIPRGSFAYRMRRDGMPQPILTLSGMRLWDAREIDAWQASRTSTRNPEE